MHCALAHNFEGYLMSDVRHVKLHACERKQVSFHAYGSYRLHRSSCAEWSHIDVDHIIYAMHACI